MYPDGLNSKKYNFDGLENEMEGKYRPGHFDGVGTIVEELFRQVQPHNAYFGEKDYQQLAIIKKMVEKTKLPVKIHGVPTLREEDGLAMLGCLLNTQWGEDTVVDRVIQEQNFRWFNKDRGQR